MEEADHIAGIMPVGVKTLAGAFNFGAKLLHPVGNDGGTDAVLDLVFPEQWLSRSNAEN